MTLLAILLGIALVIVIQFARFTASELFESQKQLQLARRQNAKLYKDIAAHLAAADKLYGHVVKLEGRRYVILQRWWKCTAYRKLTAPTWRKP